MPNDLIDGQTSPTCSPIRLLVFGANGVFGRRTLRRLSLLPELEINAVCRSKDQALALAKSIGPTIVPLWGNVHNCGDVRTLSRGMHAIFHCAGPFSTQPLHPLTVALEEGLDYADLGDDPSYLKITSEILATASHDGRLAICGASSLPSMTSLLAALAKSKYGPIEEIDIHVFIGNRNPKGWGAIQYLIHALRHPFLAMREGTQVTERSWSGFHYFRNDFDSSIFPFSRIESPDDHFLPRWFEPKAVAFWVSLQFSWIHHFIKCIRTIQRVSPAALDSGWVNLMFYSHPLFLKSFGSSLGWLNMTTTHQTSNDLQIVRQQFSSQTDGQLVPSFPLTVIGKILSGILPRPAKRIIRFIDLLTPQEFIDELHTEGVDYHISPKSDQEN